jgi:hypothetical protein
MDHNTHATNTQQIRASDEGTYDAYVTENGKRYRVPYRIIKRVTFENVDRRELVDIPHAARLQYRLMMMDPIIKATVNFTKAKIIIIFNPVGAENSKEKISLGGIVDTLAKEGVNVSAEAATVEDYDYYKNLYSYAYAPPSIRERVPWGYTREQWDRMKIGREERAAQAERAKQEKFRKFQEGYLEDNPEKARLIDPSYTPKPGTSAIRLFGKKRKDQSKGFWFHGI